MAANNNNNNNVNESLNFDVLEEKISKTTKILLSKITVG